MNIRVFRIESKRTNELLERIAIALEQLTPAVPDTEVSAVVDEFTEPRDVDESEGLDEIRSAF